MEKFPHFSKVLFKGDGKTYLVIGYDTDTEVYILSSHKTKWHKREFTVTAFEESLCFDPLYTTPKFNVGDKVVVVNNLKDEYPNVMTVTYVYVNAFGDMMAWSDNTVIYYQLDGCARPIHQDNLERYIES